MPFRTLAAKEMGELLRVLSHPDRICIIEELRSGERDVTSIQTALSISHAGVSQHLMQLRAYRLVAKRRDGKRMMYRLLQPDLARWLAESLSFLEEEPIKVSQRHEAIRKARAVWKSS